MMAMERKTMRIAVSAVFAAALLIVMMMCAQERSFAEEYNLRNPLQEGVSTSVTWGTEYDSNAVTYAQFTTSKKGYVTFTADFSCYVMLCNSKKKVVSNGTQSSGEYVNSNSSYPYQRTISFGVAKGKTYFFKIKYMPGSKNSSGEYVGTLKWTGKKISPCKYGKKKSKARTIKKKKTVKGLFVAGNRKGQWFKITNKQKTTKITVTSKKVNYRMKYKIYYKSYGKWYDITYSTLRSDDYYKDVITGTVSRKAKHTYYIKVFPDAKTSGYYTIKWK